MARTRRIALPDLKDEKGVTFATGQWVDVLDPQFLSYKRVREIRELLQGMTENDLPTEDALAALVMGWHVADVEGESDQYLDGKPTADDIGRAPLPALMAVAQTIGSLAETLIPKGNGSTS